MLFFEQLDFLKNLLLPRRDVVPRRAPISLATKCAPAPSAFFRGQDVELEAVSRELLRSVDAAALLPLVRVEWNPRLRTAAGRADFHRKLISLNPRLREHGAAEIDRTLRHELAHLVAHLRAGRRRIAPHGAEWRRACVDLGIGDEKRCHSLPFPVHLRARPFLYRCPKCAAEFPRTRRIRRAVACLTCCRRYNRGRFQKEFQLRLVRASRRA